MFERILSWFKKRDFAQEIIDEIRNSPHFKHIKIGEIGSLHIDKYITLKSIKKQ